PIAGVNRLFRLGLAEFGRDDEPVELVICHRSAGLSGPVGNATKRVCRNQPLVGRPIEWPLDDGDDVGLRPRARPFGTLGHPCRQVIRDAILVVYRPESVGLSERLEDDSPLRERARGVYLGRVLEELVDDSGDGEWASLERRVQVAKREDLPQTPSR